MDSPAVRTRSASDRRVQDDGRDAAAWRSSNVADAEMGVDVEPAWRRDGRSWVDGHVSLTREGFGEGWARMAEGSEKLERLVYPIARHPARFLRKAGLPAGFEMTPTSPRTPPEGSRGMYDKLRSTRQTGATPHLTSLQPPSCR